MQQLPLTYRKNGYDYKQVFRDDNTAIYEQHSEGKLIAFEVFEIVVQKEGEVFGKAQPEREKVPSTEQWGSKAFTVHSLQAAIEKRDVIKKNIEAAKQVDEIIKATT